MTVGLTLLRLRLGLAVLEPGLRHILGDITRTHSMAVTRTVVTQQLLFLLHANVRL